MSKKIFLTLGIIFYSLSFVHNSHAMDLDKTLKKTKETITQGIDKTKDIVENVVDTTKESVQKVIDKVKEEAPVEKEVSFFEKIKSFLSFEKAINVEFSLFYILLIAFLIGILTSFTPCIYPMIPITMGILQSQASQSVGRNFLLSTAYVTGMASVYAALGYFAATTTLILGQWLANPWFIGFLVLLFLYLAFSMFGFYEIKMPRFLQKGSSVKVKGSILYSFIFGAISGTAASPCLTPPLALLLGYVAKTGNPLIGLATLFTFSFGMGLLLIVVGTFSNSITNLPRAGTWMNEIKKFFGFLLIGVSIYFLQPLINPTLGMILFGALAVATLGYYTIIIGKNLIKKNEK